MVLDQLNFPAIFLCIPVWLAIHALWHSPLIVQGPIGKHVFGITTGSRFGREQWLLVPVAFVSATAIAIAMEWYQTAGGHVYWLTGLAIGCFFWAGLVVPLRSVDLVFRPGRLSIYVLDITSALLVFAATGALLGIWETR